MGRKTWAVFAIALAVSIIVGYLLLPQDSMLPPTAQQIASPRADVPGQKPTQPNHAPLEPVILYHLDITPAAELPLGQGLGKVSLLEALSNILDKKWLDFILPDKLILHIVATVDNLPRKYLPASVVPLRRAKGVFVVSGIDGNPQIDSSNSVRYTAYIKLIQSANTEKLVFTYRRFYPLFQKSYEELGYPKAYFNDRLVEAIDDLLAAPDFDEPVRLTQPKILFEFADPELQALSSGQKIMIRVGRENSALIKKKLNEIRKLVTSFSRAS